MECSVAFAVFDVTHKYVRGPPVPMNVPSGKVVSRFSSRYLLRKQPWVSRHVYLVLKTVNEPVGVYTVLHGRLQLGRKMAMQQQGPVCSFQALA